MPLPGGSLGQICADNQGCSCIPYGLKIKMQPWPSQLLASADLDPWLRRLEFKRNDSYPVQLQQVSSYDVPNLRCLPVVASGATTALVDVLVDAVYHHYQHCTCLPGLEIASAGTVQGLERIQCVPEKSKKNATTIVVFTVLGAAVAAAVAAVAALTIIRNRHALGPPGQPLSLRMI